jgi:hypothetical protein
MGPGFRRYGQREIKRGPTTRFTLDPDPAAMNLNNSLNQSEPDACAFAFYIQFIEQAEDALMMFGQNSNPIIAHIQDGHSIFSSSLTDLNARLFLVAHEFGRVIDQVLHNLKQALTVTKDRRQICVDMNGNTTRHDLPMHQFRRVARQFFKWDGN